MKGRPNIEKIPDESLEARLSQLGEMKAEYRANKKDFENRNKHLLESIKSMENQIIAEVIELGKTVMVGNVKAEFIPTVRIRLKKVNNGTESD